MSYYTITNNTSTSTSTTSSSQMKIPSELSQYLSDTKDNSDALVSVIRKLYKQVKSGKGTLISTTSASSTSDTSSSSTSTSDTSSSASDDTTSTKSSISNTFTRSVENFVKFYNNLISDNSSYKDSGLKDLTKKLNKVIKASSSGLSDIGITADSDGKLKLNENTFNNAVASGEFSEFVNSNEEKNGFFYNIKKIATNLNNDNTYYLSDQSKQVVKNANNNTENNSKSSSSSSIFDTYA